MRDQAVVEQLHQHQHPQDHGDQGDIGVRTLVTIAERQVASVSWTTKYRTRVDRTWNCRPAAGTTVFFPAIG
ncbi:hypothetical protein VL23_05685 [Stenotrophomonas maltophilia]|uniref:Uncharacterized protein n=1 Tax=Stenotrophomonas maltophilia TaxID=40324 RepID=A0AB34TJ70_STEMA|nr:hypothetical protein VL23_05685 [Stenotrophomonas maltophilia]